MCRYPQAQTWAAHHATQLRRRLRRPPRARPTRFFSWLTEPGKDAGADAPRALDAVNCGALTAVPVGPCVRSHMFVPTPGDLCTASATGWCAVWLQGHHGAVQAQCIAPTPQQPAKGAVRPRECRAGSGCAPAGIDVSSAGDTRRCSGVLVVAETGFRSTYGGWFSTIEEALKGADLAPVWRGPTQSRSGASVAGTQSCGLPPKSATPTLAARMQAAPIQPQTSKGFSERMRRAYVAAQIGVEA